MANNSTLYTYSIQWLRLPLLQLNHNTFSSEVEVCVYIQLKTISAFEAFICILKLDGLFRMDFHSPLKLKCYQIFFVDSKEFIIYVLRYDVIELEPRAYGIRSHWAENENIIRMNLIPG